MKSTTSYNRRPITSPTSVEDYLVDQATHDKKEDRMEDPTYDELFDIEPEAFEMLDSVGGQRGLFNYEQATKVEEGRPVKWTGLSMDGSDNHYDAGCAGLNAAALAVYNDRDPEKEFSIGNKEELRTFKESFRTSMERRIGNEYLDRAMGSLERGLRNRGVNTNSL